LWRSITPVNPLIIETVVRDLALLATTVHVARRSVPPHLENIFST